MSYRHPRFYREDYTGFNKGLTGQFETTFGNMMEYYDKKIAARKKYEKDIFNQADEMRKQAKNAEQVGANFMENTEAQIQSFIRESLEVEGLDRPGFFGQNIRGIEKSQLDLDKANATFNAKIAAANNLTDIVFVQGLDLDEDHDHGSDSYLEYATIAKALKGGNTDMNLTYDKNNEFGFNITVENPYWRTGDPESEKMKTYSAEDIQIIIGENNPEIRKKQEEQLETTLETFSGQVKTNLDDAFSKGKAYGDPTKGVAYNAKRFIEAEVDEFMLEMQKQDENNPEDGNITDQIFNNNVRFNDKTRAEALESVGGKYLIDLAYDGLKAGDQGNKEEILAMILDMPKNQIQFQEKLLKELGVQEKDIDKALDVIDKSKDKLVKRYLINEIEGKGIGSKYIQGATGDDPNALKTGKTRFGSGVYDKPMFDRVKRLYDETIQPLSEKQLDFGSVDELPKIEAEDVTGMVESGAGTEVAGKQRALANKNWFRNIFSDQGTPEQVANHINDIFEDLNNLEDVDKEVINEAVAKGKGVEIKDNNGKVVYNLEEDDAKLLQEYQVYMNKGMDQTVQLKQFFNNPASKVVYQDVQYFPNEQLVKFAIDGQKAFQLDLKIPSEWDQLGQELANAGLGSVDEINAILNLLKTGGTEEIPSKQWQSRRDDLNPNT